MLDTPTARISACLLVVALVGAALFVARRDAVTLRGGRTDSARAAAARPSIGMRPLPPRTGRDQARGGAGQAGGSGGPWYVICARHAGGYCSDPYSDFDVAMARAETHRATTRHVGVGVSTACPF